MAYEFSVIERPTQKVLSIRTRSAVQDLPRVIGEVYGKIFSYMQDLGVNPTDAPFVGYFNMDMDNLDIEIGVPIDKDLPEKDNMKISEIPGGKYASTLHIGPYNEIKLAYKAISDWIEKNHKNNYYCYELYLNDPADTPEAELQTQIIFAIE